MTGNRSKVDFSLYGMRFPILLGLSCACHQCRLTAWQLSLIIKQLNEIIQMYLFEHFLLQLQTVLLHGNLR